MHFHFWICALSSISPHHRMTLSPWVSLLLLNLPQISQMLFCIYLEFYLILVLCILSTCGQKFHYAFHIVYIDCLCIANHLLSSGTWPLPTLLTCLWSLLLFFDWVSVTTTCGIPYVAFNVSYSAFVFCKIYALHHNFNLFSILLFTFCHTSYHFLLVVLSSTFVSLTVNSNGSPITIIATCASLTIDENYFSFSVVLSRLCTSLLIRPKMFQLHHLVQLP